jgi:hypothetical protein
MQWNPSDLKVENVVTGSIAKVAQDRHGIIARSVSAAAGSFVVLLRVRSRHSLTSLQVETGPRDRASQEVPSREMTDAMQTSRSLIRWRAKPVRRTFRGEISTISGM